MTWNIKFGGARIDFFFDCYGDRVVMTEQEVIQNLAGLLRKIRQVKPDILLIQELDRFSKRSAYVDMLQYIADSAGLPYAVYASQWDMPTCRRRVWAGLTLAMRFFPAGR